MPHRGADPAFGGIAGPRGAPSLWLGKLKSYKNDGKSGDLDGF